jgi:hypothetical protein
VVVLDLKTSTTTTLAGGALSQVVAAEVAKVPGYAVLTTRDLQAAIAHEADRQLLGCDDDTGCLAELADAVDAELLVHGTLSTTIDDVGGSTPLVTLTLLNTRALVVVNRITFPWRGEEKAWPDVVATATEHLVLPASQRPPGGIHVVGLVPGARVFLDGQDRSFTAHGGVLGGVTSGPHEVRVSLEGKLPSVTYVVVKSGGVVAVQPVLEDAPLPDVLLWGGAACAAVLGVGVTLGAVWAMTPADVNASVVVPAWSLADVEKLKGPP